MSKVRLWESQRGYVICLSQMHATPQELTAIFGASDSALQAAVNGQKASTGYLDLTGGRTRTPAMPKSEYDAILDLANRQLVLHPQLTQPYDRLRKLLAATYEQTAAEEVAVQERLSGVAGAIDRIGDTYTALGEQLVELAREARAEHSLGIELIVRQLLDERLPKLVGELIEDFFG